MFISSESIREITDYLSRQHLDSIKIFCVNHDTENELLQWKNAGNYLKIDEIFPCERLELALVYFGIRFCESRGDDQDEANTAVKHNNYEDAKALTLAHSQIAASILDQKIQNLMDKPAVVCVT
ncbi:unnamed protein product [Didymodactylos carnosus]|uniref:Uncharacterized protein n=1 Tax=Didymodactylos carnosus TaxID=1234261 RepID=A0A815KML2_9BILA|nr:unnamed protein product [Didymodactylos carnosus]CAF1469073.1 unnamed protein product [Didymodactylos carnosus]CAF4261262.1 unnamed protein product [Didymodactylos carnosus]CAF4292366.1 unnamed protein product [Didymodactylos carnosus]